MEKIKMNAYEIIAIRAFLDCAAKCLKCGDYDEAMKEIENAIEFIEDYHSEYY